MAQPSRSIQEIDDELKGGIKYAVQRRETALSDVQLLEFNGSRLEDNRQLCRDIVVLETAVQAARNRFIQACTSAGITNWQETDEGYEANNLVRLHGWEAAYLQRAQNYVQNVAYTDSLRQLQPSDASGSTPFHPQARIPSAATVQNTTGHYSHVQRNSQSLHPAHHTSAPASSIQTPPTATLIAQPGDVGYWQLRNMVGRNSLYAMDQPGNIYRLSHRRQ